MESGNGIIFNALTNAAGHTGATMDGSQIRSISAQAIITGSGAAGVLKLQASNEDVATIFKDVSGVTVTISGAGTYVIPKTDVCYRWLRFVSTDTSSGSATGTNTSYYHIQIEQPGE